VVWATKSGVAPPQKWLIGSGGGGGCDGNTESPDAAYTYTTVHGDTRQA